ncbi:MAG: hypothetical protein A3J69_01985 [Candidatus Levybacteria bacterium RIFCSPHIGHO2_02_FULL_42_12]|nr:MAG: hypothetical protein A2698_01435 [Candidatus Levybacteria bacterium RIFCSPHIGHO2_01_FULL_42_15]OGH33968.1 MAG: hypothetical protein A3J69_01985 [Candidatus Levybacteria bacterium RIFCSPHIGHO2_02_FULL_42_12]OGH42903.1 MAG: hypothetical protein A3B53_02550 [Candidatus Levybacteria bacterium RIFCSPLOWO2_01_FULL_42_15]
MRKERNKKSKVKRRTKTFLKKYVFLLVSPFIFFCALFLLKQYGFYNHQIKSPLSLKAAGVVSRSVFLDIATSSGVVRETELILKKYNIPFVSIQQASDSAILIEIDEGKFFISSKKDIESQVSSLQRALSRFTIEGKRISLLDFRFERPIVVFQ